MPKTFTNADLETLEPDLLSPPTRRSGLVSTVYLLLSAFMLNAQRLFKSFFEETIIEKDIVYEGEILYLKQIPQLSERSTTILNSIGSVVLLSTLYELSLPLLMYFSQQLDAYHITQRTESVESISTGNAKNRRKQKTIANAMQRQMELFPRSDSGISEVYTAFLRRKNIVRILFNLFCSVCTAVRYFNQFDKMVIEETSPFSLSFPKGTFQNNSLFNFLNVPLTTPISILLIFSGIIYNFRELILSVQTSKFRRDDVPLFGLINSYVQVGASAQLELGLFTAILNKYATYNVYRNLLQICSNIRELLFDQAFIEVEEIASPLDSTNRGSFLPAFQRDQQNLAMPISVVSDVSTSHPVVSTVAELSSTPEPSLRTGSKPKTRGIPMLRDGGVNHPPILQPLKEEHLYGTDQDRQEILEDISRLQTRNTVKKESIDAVLRRLSKFLPDNFAIQDKGGSQHRLTWSWTNAQGNTRRHNIKFEDPHNDEYKGTKLTKILNVMKAAVLWGAPEEARQEYLCSQPRAISHVFGERPKIG